MGLKKSVTTNFGIDAENAYHRIKSVRGENGGEIRYHVDIYFNEEARNQGKVPMEEKMYVVPGNLRSRLGVITELYNILKQEPGYEGAEDVLEPDFFPHISTYISNAYLISAASISGLDRDTMSVTNGTVDGKFIMDGYIVSGTITEANITNISIVNDGYKNGHISGANIDGYIIQVL
jgi:hypothetical protein